MKNTIFIFLMALLIIPMNLFSQKEKKLELEFSAGVGRVNPGSIYQRSAGIDELIYQYARHYQADYTGTGELSKIKFLIPISFSVNYRWNKAMYLKAGLNYSFSGGGSWKKSSRVAWSQFYEQYDHELSNKVTYLLPHIGLGYGRGSFDIYGALGLGFARLTHREDLRYTESESAPGSGSGSGAGYDSRDTFKVKGAAPGVMVGIKYCLPLGEKSPGKNIKAFIKLEAVLLKVNSFSGVKTTTASDSQGERFSQTREGTLYEFEWTPYGGQRFPFWDLYDVLPDDAAMRNFQEMGVNLSGIRLMIGISF